MLFNYTFKAENALPGIQRLCVLNAVSILEVSENRADTWAGVIEAQPQ